MTCPITALVIEHSIAFLLMSAVMPCLKCIILRAGMLAVRSICKCPHLIILKAMYTLQNYIWMLLFPTQLLLYLSQVELLAIHPFYTNLLPTPIIISHHLFPAPCISVWNNYVSLPGLHSLFVYTHSYISIARTLYVTRVHDGLKGLN